MIQDFKTKNLRRRYSLLLRTVGDSNTLFLSLRFYEVYVFISLAITKFNIIKKNCQSYYLAFVFLTLKNFTD